MTATDQQEAIRAEGLTKRFGATTAVDGLDLTVTNGETFALLGVNGAGKSTTIAMLTQFGLDQVAHQRAHTLSGGMQRRLSIAMGLITNPKILFLDEPTVGLDVRSHAMNCGTRSPRSKARSPSCSPRITSKRSNPSPSHSPSCSASNGARVVVGIAVILPTALMYTAIGLLCGTLVSDKAVGGICGAMLTTVSFILSGLTIPLTVMGHAFQTIAQTLPFYHAAQMANAAIVSGYGRIWPHMWIVLIYMAIFAAAAILTFTMRARNR